jgi:hypothetical protein
MKHKQGYMRVNDDNLLVRCDYACKVLRVATDKALISGFRSEFHHLAQYRSWSEWSKSPYFNQITDEDAQDSISWFWHDMDMNKVQENIG